LNPLELAGKHGRKTPQEMASFYLDLLLQPPNAAAFLSKPQFSGTLTSATPGASRALVLDIVSQPEYQIN
jgi:hypothetical protein